MCSLLWPCSTIYCFNFPRSPMEETQILEPIPLGNLSLKLEKTCLNEINNEFFYELNEMDLRTIPTMSFTTFLESISI